MKKRKFSEPQIFEILKESETGAKTPELCRKQGISSATLYKWRSKYAGLNGVLADDYFDKADLDGHDSGPF